MENLKYPIGRYQKPTDFSKEDLSNWVTEVRSAPKKYKNFVLENPSLNWNKKYRENGWMARQVIHHVVDSHMNAYIRFKLTLTENNPVIKPYKEGLWAELSDSHLIDPEEALELMRLVHHRWVVIMENMSFDDFKRKYIHPETKSEFELAQVLALYSWHGIII